MTQHTSAVADRRAGEPSSATARRTCSMAEALVGSEILRIAAEIRTLSASGAQVCNLTVGDFDPSQFPIPRLLANEIEAALRRGETNYPPSDGVPALREAVAAFYRHWLRLEYSAASVVITCGSRPGIYATFRTLLDPGDRVVYPVPSWNNNHYCHLTGAVGVPIVCGRDDAFLPTPALLERPIRGARLLSLNSPLNPAGTALDAETLAAICDLVLEENDRRSPGERPLYLMYDQVYWMLTFGSTKHVDPVTLRPAIAPYTIFVDGISKAFAATGVRVGWVVGPTDIVQRMSSLLGHIGAWAPRAEQLATARLLTANEEVAAFRENITRGLRTRLDVLHEGILSLHRHGLPVDAVPPMGAIYLSARFPLNGMRAPSGAVLRTNEDIREYLLREAGLAAVPFQAFGSTDESGWFRLSVGAASVDQIERVMPRLGAALESLSE